MHVWINEYLASCLSYSKIQSMFQGTMMVILKGTITKVDRGWTRSGQGDSRGVIAFERSGFVATFTMDNQDETILQAIFVLHNYTGSVCPITFLFHNAL